MDRVPQGSCFGASALCRVHGRTQPSGRPASTDSGVERFERCLVDIENGWGPVNSVSTLARRTSWARVQVYHRQPAIAWGLVKVVSSTITTVASARYLGVVTRHRQSSHNVGPRRCSLSRRILPTSIAQTDSEVSAHRRCKDTDSGVYFKPPGLLQRCSLWHHWHPA